MGKRCPLGGYVLYLDCLECEEKKECRSGRIRSESRLDKNEGFQKVSETYSKEGMEDWQK